MLRSAAALTVVLSAAVAVAGPTPAARCLGRKTKAAGTEAYALLKCHAHGAQAGESADGGCLSAAAAKLVDAFARAESRGGCAQTGDAGAVDGEVTAFVDDAAAALRPVSTASSCAASKLRATAKKARTVLTAHARNATSPDPTRLASALADADARFTAAMAKADGRDDCFTTGDAATVESIVDDGVVRVLAKLTPVCGDGIRAGSEECDGAETGACLGACLADCTCMPVCGDDEWDFGYGEQCDGADSPNCQGLCQSDCTCPTPVCGNGVLESGEQCDGDAPTPGYCELNFAGGACQGCQCCIGEDGYCESSGALLGSCCSGECLLSGPGNARCASSCRPTGAFCNGFPYPPCCNGCNTNTFTCL